MANTYLLEVVTPSGKFFEGEVYMVIATTVDGDIGILKGHASLVTPLGFGKLRVFKSPNDLILSSTIERGFLFVHEDKVVIVTDNAQKPEEIDVAKEKSRVEKLKNIENKNTLEKMQLIWSINRIKVAEKQ